MLQLPMYGLEMKHKTLPKLQASYFCTFHGKSTSNMCNKYRTTERARKNIDVVRADFPDYTITVVEM